jgi:prophage regulatory protein
MRFLRIRDVVRMVGFSKATVYARVRAGGFPKPITLGPQTTAFLESEILDWMKAQAARNRGGHKPISCPLSVAKAKAEGGRNV